MAGYLAAISLSEQIGEGKVVSLLKESLAEEQGAEDKLRKIRSESIGQCSKESCRLATDDVRLFWEAVVPSLGSAWHTTCNVQGMRTRG